MYLVVSTQKNISQTKIISPGWGFEHEKYVKPPTSTARIWCQTVAEQGEHPPVPGHFDENATAVPM